MQSDMGVGPDAPMGFDSGSGPMKATPIADAFFKSSKGSQWGPMVADPIATNWRCSMAGVAGLVAVDLLMGLGLSAGARVAAVCLARWPV